MQRTLALLLHWLKATHFPPEQRPLEALGAGVKEAGSLDLAWGAPSRSAWLLALGLHPLSVELGIAVTAEELTPDLRLQVKTALEALEFELIDDRRMQTVQQMKALIVGLVHQPTDAPLQTNLSDYLARALGKDYGTLSKLFSEATGTTVEKYVIAQKIERAKELLTYGELTLNEIADRLGYSSTAYLSAQFKSVTGLTPTQFRQQKEKRRRPLDEI